MTIKDAIKIAECVEVDYSGMTEEEIEQMDNALDVIFKCARDKAKEEAKNDK
ncbi:hypothetical protein [Methanobrevibacter sp.]|uniref:hypothetical protein n=1 Tax=Methanobrevibacter sp. TaxID=66852 RepID=UPI00388CF4D4